MIISYEQPIADGPFSPVFIQTMHNQGFYTLGQLLSLTVADLDNYEWFTTELLDELYQYLISRK